MAIRVRRYLKQVLCYWQKKLSDRAGQSTYEPPIELACRWDDGMQQVVEADGRVVTFNAYIMLDRAVVAGSLYFRGTLAQVKAMGVQYPTVPSVKQGAKEGQRLRETTGFKGELALMEVWL